MRRFAKAGNRVIFVNSISMGLPGLSNKDLLPRIVRKLRSYTRLARPTPEGVTVVSPAVIPFFGTRLARAANRKLLLCKLADWRDVAVSLNQFSGSRFPQRLT